jgi:hypothetical protein
MHKSRAFQTQSKRKLGKRPGKEPFLRTKLKPRERAGASLVFLLLQGLKESVTGMKCKGYIGKDSILSPVNCEVRCQAKSQIFCTVKAHMVPSTPP